MFADTVTQPNTNILHKNTGIEYIPYITGGILNSKNKVLVIIILNL